MDWFIYILNTSIILVSLFNHYIWELCHLHIIFLVVSYVLIVNWVNAQFTFNIKIRFIKSIVWLRYWIYNLCLNIFLNWLSLTHICLGVVYLQIIFISIWFIMFTLLFIWDILIDISYIFNCRNHSIFILRLEVILKSLLRW